MHKRPQTFPPDRIIKRQRKTLVSRELTGTYTRKNEILSLAASHWRNEASKTSEQASAFDVTANIYRQHILGTDALGALTVLDGQLYFQLHLWPNFCALVTTEDHKEVHHDWSVLQAPALSICALFNYQHAHHPSRGVEFLRSFDDDEDALQVLVEALFRFNRDNLSSEERCICLLFLLHLFRGIDHGSVKRALLPLVSLPVWTHLSEDSYQQQIRQFPFLRKPLTKLKRRALKRSVEKEQPLPEFAVFSVIKELEDMVFIFVTNSSKRSVAEIGKTLSLLSELLSQLRFRRTLLPLVSDRFTLPLVKGLYRSLPVELEVHDSSHEELAHNLDQFAYYVTFPLDIRTGTSLSRDSIRAERARRLLTLQRISHTICERDALPTTHALRKLSMNTHNAIGHENTLQSIFRDCNEPIIQEVMEGLGMKSLWNLFCADEAYLLRNATVNKNVRNLFGAAISCYCAASRDIFESFKTTPLMVNENDLWGASGANGSRSTADLPVINLDFLNLTDYLLRNFTLFKLESAWSIRENIEESLLRMRPSFDEDGVKFNARAKMAAPIKSIRIAELGHQLLDSPALSYVRVDVEVDIAQCPGNICRAWGNLQQHDVIFLVWLQPPPGGIPEEGKNGGSYDTFSNCRVRGLVIGTFNERDAGGQLVARRDARGSTICISGFLDGLQFYYDSQTRAAEDVLRGYKVAVRRPSEMNNFYPILSSMRALIRSENCILPQWLEDVLLGRLAEKRKLADVTENSDEHTSVDFADSFVSTDHVRQSFPSFRVLLPDSAMKNSRSISARVGFKLVFHKNEAQDCIVKAESYMLESGKPNWKVRADHVKGAINETVFNENQIVAIRSGISTGLTLISGPPGTGKTSCVVQILSTLHQTEARERILVVTRTNHALNDLVRRLLLRGANPLKLLRLGQGADVGAADESLSKDGRVRALLQRRIKLLSMVQELAALLDQRGKTEAEWSCESAAAFFKDVVEKEWNLFLSRNSEVREPSPFRKFFIGSTEGAESAQNGPEQSGSHRGGENDFRSIRRIFEELKELRFLEVLRTKRQRANYLVAAHASVVAMTCVHAAMQRDELVSQCFSYDTVVMEEAAEILEVEAFLSLILQKPGRLKRVVLVGDHKQLPPVIQYSALQQSSNFGQSMFTRLCRTGTEVCSLKYQGRCRRSIADLFRWRYPGLQDMEFIREGNSFSAANPGFLHTAQFVDTGHEGSESMPLNHFYQNVVEAEYIAFMFLYMRIVGYPADRIAVLTTYNGQVQLLEEVIAARSSQFGELGKPVAISTVDKFQGQQADYVLLSLVRTKHLGHFRDVRRITVAVSRARLGLYIFGYLPLFQCSAEFQPVLSQLQNDKLVLVAEESFLRHSRKEPCESSIPACRLREVHSPADMASVVSHLHDLRQKMNRASS